MFMYCVFAIYHIIFIVQFTGGYGRLSKAQWFRLLLETGVAVTKADVMKTFIYFDVNLNDYINREEFAFGLFLTDHEVDVLADDIRRKLLIGVNGRTKLKNNRTFREIFEVLNTNRDSILSVAEIMNMAAQLDVFLSEEEGRKVLKIMDVDNDDKVVERDFMVFMKKPTDIVIKKAHRLREAVTIFRRWIVRGANMGVRFVYLCHLDLL